MGVRMTPYCLPSMPRASSHRVCACNLSLSFHRAETVHLDGMERCKCFLNVSENDCLFPTKRVLQDLTCNCIMVSSEGNTMYCLLGFTLQQGHQICKYRHNGQVRVMNSNCKLIPKTGPSHDNFKVIKPSCRARASPQYVHEHGLTFQRYMCFCPATFTLTA